MKFGGIKFKINSIPAIFILGSYINSCRARDTKGARPFGGRPRPRFAGAARPSRPRAQSARGLGDKIQGTIKSRNLQMSFWGATVITNMVSAIPYLGADIVSFIWGGFSVDNPTLNRFFSLHFLLPFVLAALAVIHLIYKDVHGSNNPLGLSSNMDKVPLHPYFSYKDYFGFAIFGIAFSFVVFFYPNVLGH